MKVFLAFFIIKLDDCSMAQAQTRSEYFIISSGDGNQKVVGEKLRLQRINPEWFDGKVYRSSEFFEDAYLLKVISMGEYHNRMVALTSRVLMSLDDQFRERKYASTVVHVISDEFSSRRITAENSSPEGMAFVDYCS